MEQYLSSFRDGENIYYLNKEGRERVNCQKLRKKTTQARHYIMRNDLYIAFGQPKTWKNEIKLGSKNDKKLRVICDALFLQGSKYHIVEVDHMQKMHKNKKKIERYRQLIAQGLFEVKPKFIWITVTDHRRNEILKCCEGLDVQIFTVEDFH